MLWNFHVRAFARGRTEICKYEEADNVFQKLQKLN